MTWIPVPEPLTWQIPKPVKVGAITYTEVVLRAPTGEDVLLVTALPGSNLETTFRLIETVSGVPFDVIKTLPHWLIRQMSDYMDEFAGAPAPDPLEAWRKARMDAAIAEAEAAAEAAKKADAPPTEVREVS
jgi:hypothetical protein